MSSAFSTKTPKIRMSTVKEPMETVEESQEEVSQRIRKKAPPGKQENLLYGILMALKKRLGE